MHLKSQQVSIRDHSQLSPLGYGSARVLKLAALIPEFLIDLKLNTHHFKVFLLKLNYIIGFAFRGVL